MANKAQATVTSGHIHHSPTTNTEDKNKMAIITHGSFDNLAAAVSAEKIAEFPALEQIQNFGLAREITRALQPISLKLQKSPENFGITLRSITLSKGFDSFIRKIFNPTNEIYFTALAWDLSGNPIVPYPGNSTEPQSNIIKMKPGDTREFMGNGILLFPPRAIKSGVTVRIFIWESDAEINNAGKILSNIAAAAQGSQLSALLSTLSLATETPLATIELIKNAAIELTKAISTILKSNTPDFVDFFEGYFPASGSWNNTVDHFAGYGSRIELMRISH